jgi:hypothetical protein
MSRQCLSSVASASIPKLTPESAGTSAIHSFTSVAAGRYNLHKAWSIRSNSALVTMIHHPAMHTGLPSPDNLATLSDRQRMGQSQPNTSLVLRTILFPPCFRSIDKYGR